MSNIVEFPGTKSANPLVAERLNCSQPPRKSKFDFTCVGCQNVTHFEIENALFRHIELFCGKCGMGWKVSNPSVASVKASGN